MTSDRIKCRARVADDCLHGCQPDLVYEDGDMTEDGTYQEHDRTLICEPCYVVVMEFSPSGRGLHSELPVAIARARQANGAI